MRSNAMNTRPTRVQHNCAMGAKVYLAVVEEEGEVRKKKLTMTAAACPSAPSTASDSGPVRHWCTAAVTADRRTESTFGYYF